MFFHIGKDYKHTYLSATKDNKGDDNPHIIKSLKIRSSTTNLNLKWIFTLAFQTEFKTIMVSLGIDYIPGWIII